MLTRDRHGDAAAAGFNHHWQHRDANATRTDAVTAPLGTQTASHANGGATAAAASGGATAVRGGNTIVRGTLPFGIGGSASHSAALPAYCPPVSTAPHGLGLGCSGGGVLEFASPARFGRHTVASAAAVTTTRTACASASASKPQSARAGSCGATSTTSVTLKLTLHADVTINDADSAVNVWLHDDFAVVERALMMSPGFAMPAPVHASNTAPREANHRDVTAGRWAGFADSDAGMDGAAPALFVDTPTFAHLAAEVDPQAVTCDADLLINVPLVL